MKQITIKGKIEFCKDENKEYNREFTAILQDSGAFAYGNQTVVTILWGVMANGMLPAPVCLDTRYDRTIKRNETGFKKWVQNYFKENYGKIGRVDILKRSNTLNGFTTTVMKSYLITSWTSL